jgi:hypothetical protein
MLYGSRHTVHAIRSMLHGPRLYTPVICSIRDTSVNRIGEKHFLSFMKDPAAY